VRIDLDDINLEARAPQRNRCGEARYAAANYEYSLHLAHFITSAPCKKVRHTSTILSATRIFTTTHFRFFLMQTGIKRKEKAEVSGSDFPSPFSYTSKKMSKNGSAEKRSLVLCQQCVF